MESEQRTKADFLHPPVPCGKEKGSLLLLQIRMRTPGIVRIESYHSVPEQGILAGEALSAAAASRKKPEKAAKR